MSTIQSVQDIAAPSQQTQKFQTQLNQDFDDFLLLLTTQLKNQDPLEPQDTSEFTKQLVMFSQVEQQIKSNDILEDLRALDLLRITDLGLSFVGMDVEMAGKNFKFNGDNDIDLGYIIPKAAKSTNISIKNADGNVVYTMSGEVAAGIHSFKWDGTNRDGFKVPPGIYSIEVSAQSNEGENLRVQTNVPGRVTGIESDGGGNIMLLIGDLRVPISDVIRAREASDKFAGNVDQPDPDPDPDPNDPPDEDPNI